MSPEERHREAPDAAIAGAAGVARQSRRDLAEAIRAACPQPHQYVQHRDRQPPWCPACRYTADGERISGGRGFEMKEAPDD